MNNELDLIQNKLRIKVEEKINKALKGRQPESLYGPGAYILESGGKRIRPLLVLLSLKAAGGNLNSGYNAAAAVELLHNFTLVHDDIMDNADKRRGRKTIHNLYDVNTAILSGDSLLSIAYELLLKDCKNNIKEIITAFNKSLIEVCEGQSLDKDFETKNPVTIDEYYKMIEKKTSALLEMCCKVGVYLGSGEKKLNTNLSLFGKYLGLAFQIQDDLLDITGEEDKFGKVCGGDLLEGKKTYLFLKALEKAQGDDLNQLNKVIEQKGANKSEIPYFKKLYFKLGVIDDASNEVKKFSIKALNKLKTIKNEKDRVLLVQLAESLINRSK